jgi:RimJ/RimL family protein N-acetyltransferase
MGLVIATVEDAEFLFRIRNDPLTRAMSLSSQPVEWSAHMKWLKSALDDPRRTIYIAHRDAPIGSGRIDRLDDGAVLSWTIAPEWRGHGLGGALVHALIALAPSGALVAQIKSTNRASIALAQQHHFKRQTTTGDVEKWMLLKPEQ